MNTADFENLIDQIRKELAAVTIAPKIAIIGFTASTLKLLEALRGMQLLECISGIYISNGRDYPQSIPIKPMASLRADCPNLVVVASDKEKESLLTEAAPYLNPQTRILIAGFSHLQFSDPEFEDEVQKAVLPSLANGYPNSLIHIYQCLKNAARLRLQGVVAEFGMFKGGTTMLISQFIERLGMPWKVYGFDSFSGFPARRSPLDMYAHPDCVFLDEPMIRRMFQGRNVQIIAGDIVQTIGQIRDEPIVLAFVDTDNFSPAAAVIDVIQDRVVPGGAIVFDHFAGRNRFLYTLGERIAAKRLLSDPRYFNLHDTGVFLRQQS
jgi:O-methyltransferase